MTIYDFTVKNAGGQDVPLAEFKGKVLLVVNTASKCGFTPQYAQLQELYNRHHEQGLEILAFPCDQFAHQEPGTDEEIQQFCQLNYGLTFPVYAKIDVNGKDAHPLFKHLRSAKKTLLGDTIKWNFTKFLVDRRGEFAGRYEPTVNPLDMQADIEKLLGEADHD